MTLPFVSRTFLVVDGERSFGVELRVFSPSLGSEGEYVCSCELLFPDKSSSFRIEGVDGVQAMLLALMFLSDEMEQVAKHHGWQLKDYQFVDLKRLR